jgi:hypothetical protein
VIECNVFRDEMLDVLYGEADAATRRRFQDHEAHCAACREELSGLRRLRQDLAAWPLPPASRLPAAGRTRLYRPLAVAAGLVLALGAALGLSGSEVRYGEGHVAFRLGRQTAPADEPAVEQRLAALEARQRDEMQALRAELARVKDARNDDVLLARVSDMIRRSELRQTELVGASMASLRDETEARRRYDLAQVGAGLSYLDGKTGLQAARTTELMGHVLQAAQKR